MPSIIEAFAAVGQNMTRFTERRVPDSWVVCMMLTTVTLVVAVVGAGVGIEDAILAWGAGMWNLLELAMQFTVALVAAHTCICSRPVFRLLDRLAGLPDEDRPLQAVLLMGLFSIATAYVNWALTIIASALFLPFVCRRNPKADSGILIAAAYLGIGTVWHGGLSGSAPLILATPGNPLYAPNQGSPVIDRLIPATETLFCSFNLIYLAVVSAAGLLVLIALHPRQGAVTLADDRINSIVPPPPAEETLGTSGSRLDRFRGWNLLAAVLILYPLGHSFVTKGFDATWTINAYNMVFLAAALLLQGRPASLVKVVPQGVQAASGVILQFPFYAGIFGVMSNTDLGRWLGELFVSLATTTTFPLIVYLYSGLVNLFVPSGGSKWLIEAPYLLPAARELGVSPVTTVLAYGYGDSTTNLIQPFWALPLLAVARARFGDILGYTFLVALVCFAISVVAMLLIPPNL